MANNNGNNVRNPDPNYIPPESDPRMEGEKHWHTLRQELTLAREKVSELAADLMAANRMINQLEQRNLTLEKLSDRDRRECVSLRTSLEDIARLLIDKLHGATEARDTKGAPTEYAPPNNRDRQVAEIEQLLTKPNDPPPLFLENALADALKKDDT